MIQIDGKFILRLGAIVSFLGMVVTASVRATQYADEALLWRTKTDTSIIDIQSSIVDLRREIHQVKARNDTILAIVRMRYCKPNLPICL